MKYYIALILAIMFWGSSFIATKIAYTSFTPMLVCLLRFIISSVLMTLYGLTRKRPHPTKQDWKNIMLSAVFGITVYYALENIGLTLTTASDASLISASYPVITVIVGMLFYNIHISRKSWIGILTAMLGIFILTARTAEAASDAFTGDMLLIMDGFLWGFYNYITQAVSSRCDSYSISWYQILIGTVLFVPLTFIEAPVIGEVTLPAVLALLYLGICCTMAALILYNYGLRSVSAKTAVSLMNLMPVFGLLFSALILHEKITLIQIIGGIIVLIGVGLSADR